MSELRTNLSYIVNDYCQPGEFVGHGSVAGVARVSALTALERVRNDIAMLVDTTTGDAEAEALRGAWHRVNDLILEL